MILSRIMKSNTLFFIDRRVSKFSNICLPKVLSFNINCSNFKQNLNYICFLKGPTISKETSYKLSAQITMRNRFGFCRSKTYVDKYNNLKVWIKQKEQRVNQLKDKLHMLQKISQMSISDHLMKQLFQLVGKTYESKAFKEHKQILIDLRNQLQRKIQESSLKWEQPRKLILEQRENKINQFIENIIQYQGKIAVFIKSRQQNNQQHLADINEGIVLTHKLLIRNIQKQGGTRIQPSPGSAFNSEQHESADNPDKQAKNLSIKAVDIPGWIVKEHVVKKAKVTTN